VGEGPGFVLVALTWIVLAVLLAARKGPFRPDEVPSSLPRIRRKVGSDAQS
jgi:hypothetical protein